MAELVVGQDFEALVSDRVKTRVLAREQGGPWLKAQDRPLFPVPRLQGRVLEPRPLLPMTSL
jgi:hypothetical protein